eukprot:COSAG01_NODE_2317_length_7922_cov_18.384763_3_plen_172_part_00
MWARRRLHRAKGERGRRFQVLVLMPGFSAAWGPGWGAGLILVGCRMRRHASGTCETECFRAASGSMTPAAPGSTTPVSSSPCPVVPSHGTCPSPSISPTLSFFLGIVVGAVPLIVAIRGKLMLDRNRSDRATFDNPVSSPGSSSTFDQEGDLASPQTSETFENPINEDKQD